MPHSVFTIVTPVDPAVGPDGPRLDCLREVLFRMQKFIQGDTKADPGIPFEKFTQLHFASLVIFDRKGEDPLLVFENNVDGSIDAYLNDLLAGAERGIDAIYENCKGFPQSGTTDEKRGYLKKNVRKPHLYHIGAPYRQVGFIKEDAELRDHLDTQVDELVNGLPPQPPAPRHKPGGKRHPWLAWLSLVVLGVLTATIGLCPTSALAWAAWTLVLVIAVWSIRSWRQARSHERAQYALLGASPQTDPAAARIWKQLRAESPPPRDREPRNLERFKNWLLALSPVPVATVLFRYLWPRPGAILAILATLFALQALWLLLLVGWPSPAGEWKRSWLFVLIAAAGGAFLGSWPAYRPGSAWTAVALSAGATVAAVVRFFSPRRVREADGYARTIPFTLVAAGAGWFTVAALGSLGITTGIEQPVADPMRSLALVAKAAVAAVVSVGAFIGIVILAIRRTSPQGSAVVLWLVIPLGAILAALFWLLSGPTPFCLSPSADTFRLWAASLLLALVSFALLLALMVVPVPTPSTDQFERPVPNRLRRLTADEDRHVINHMATMVRVRDDSPGRARLLKLFLSTRNRLFYRTLLPDFLRGTLFGIPTVHFAQWTVLDARHHMFLSNYDFTWNAYLDEFGSQLKNGIQQIWGQSEGNPGVSNMHNFKDFVRTQMVPYAVWYSAYRDLSVERIRNNENIRLALLAGDTGEEAIAEKP
jgi:hypothetical protein